MENANAPLTQVKSAYGNKDPFRGISVLIHFVRAHALLAHFRWRKPTKFEFFRFLIVLPTIVCLVT